MCRDWRDRSIWRSCRLSRRDRGAACSPKYPAGGQALIDFFLIEKAIYEIDYELANRPAWVAIPLRGILRVLSDRRRAA